jgi:CheY-like chemotaxis protein
LTGILGFINFFEEELSIEQKTEYLKIINKSSDRLLNTINDIIEISRLNSGISIKKIETFDIRKSLNAFLNDNNLRYGNLEIVFSLVIDSKLDDLWIQTDHSKLFIIIKNLLDNAYKFTNKGSINLTIKIQENSLLVIVKDTGIGIAPAYHEQIFEAFRQVDSNSSKAYQGNGLGLTIARKYVNYLGGKIGLESEPGKGTTFYFVLPEVVNSKMTKTEKKSTNIVHKEKELIGKTILIAEDENTNFMYLKAVLSKSGYTLVHAVNGYEAVEICKSTDKLDLVIMDLKMPVMDGIEASRKIKEMRKNLPIIAHSAYALNDEKQEALTAGCIDYLPKPAKPNQLLEMISKYISGNNNQTSNSEFMVNSYFY